MSKDEVCKIADFGLSRETNDDNAYDVKTVRKHLQNVGLLSSCHHCREGKSLFGGLPLRQFNIASSHRQAMFGVTGYYYGK